MKNTFYTKVKALAHEKMSTPLLGLTVCAPLNLYCSLNIVLQLLYITFVCGIHLCSSVRIDTL